MLLIESSNDLMTLRFTMSMDVMDATPSAMPKIAMTVLVFW
jgi:hypothetical protein